MAQRSTTACRAMAKVRRAVERDGSSMRATISAQTSRMVVSAATHDCLSCCERKYESSGNEMWLSSNSADQPSQSRRSARRSSPASW